MNQNKKPAANKGFASIWAEVPTMRNCAAMLLLLQLDIINLAFVVN